MSWWTIYERASGEIAGHVRGSEDSALAQESETRGVIEGYFLPDEYRVVDGLPVPRTEAERRPWREKRLLDEVRAVRDRLLCIHWPVGESDTVQIDDFSLALIRDRIDRLSSGEEWVFWRTAENRMVAIFAPVFCAIPAQAAQYRERVMQASFRVKDAILEGSDLRDFLVRERFDQALKELEDGA